MKIILVITTIISAASAASRSNRIIGGAIAEDGQFPYQASFKYFRRHLCGASIINDRWALTAAHCVKGYYVDLMTIITGSNTLSVDGDIYQAEKYIYHEKYSANEDTTIFDIALIKVETRIIFNEKVQPIPLNKVQIPPGADLIISGWGIVKHPNDDASDVLKFLKVKAVGTKECQASFKELGYDVNDAQQCAFARDGEGACSGDSGSPLVYNGALAGIASWVEPCGIGYPDVYTKVSEYIGWIELNIWLN